MERLLRNWQTHRKVENLSVGYKKKSKAVPASVDSQGHGAGEPDWVTAPWFAQEAIEALSNFSTGCGLSDWLTRHKASAGHV